jgi:hypothetical protein
MSFIYFNDFMLYNLLKIKLKANLPHNSSHIINNKDVEEIKFALNPIPFGSFF